MIFWRYNPQAGAGGAQYFLFFDFNTFSKSLISHLFSLTYFKHPIIDLTWFLRNDCEFKTKKIFSFFFFIFIFFKVLTGELAWQLEDRKALKLWVPSSFFEAFFNTLRSSLDLICQTLYLSSAGGEFRLRIIYLYSRSFAENLAWNLEFLLIIFLIEIFFLFKK